VTPKRKTHFEQVPLEVIKKIVEENARQERTNTGEDARGTKKKDAEADLLEALTANGWSERG
jgi:hypothetical protein